MAILLRMPSLSPTMETGVITTWSKKAGDFIDAGEVLAEIETDKAVMEFEMVDEGFIREFLVEPGTEVPVGTPIAILAESMEEDISAVKAEAAAGNGGAPATAPEAPPVAQASGTPAAGAAPAAPQVAAAQPAAPTPAPPPPPASAPPAAPAPSMGNGGSNGSRVKISPYARKLAQERQLDISALSGSGPGGRIVAKDIESALAGGVAAPAAQAAPGTPGVAFVPFTATPGGAPFEDQPLSMMRKAIARKMVESKTSVPHFQLTRKIRAEPMLESRAALKARFPDLRVTVNDILVKACAMALRQHPAVNSQFMEDRIRRINTVDISVAVGTEDGLITPVVRNADLKGLVQISSEIKALAEKAKDKKLAPEEYTGGTFTLSNLGMYAVTEFNAIINTPQACILAVSGVVTEPVVEEGQLAVGQTMNMTLSSDHRVVDGLTAAQFMDTLAAMLETPVAMLL